MLFVISKLISWRFYKTTCRPHIPRNHVRSDERTAGVQAGAGHAAAGVPRRPRRLPAPVRRLCWHDPRHAATGAVTPFRHRLIY